MYRWSAAAAVALLLALIGLGSFVRTTGSGLGCPDWPLCHGGVLPPLERTALTEWSHRALAAVAGLAVMAFAGWTWRLGRDRQRRGAAVLLVTLLLLQALLGRETVHRELPPELVALHLSVAMALLALVVWLGVSAPDRRRVTLPVEALRAVRLTVVLVGVVIVAGAYVVASGAGLACSTWPACEEAPLPIWGGDRLEVVQWLHRLAVVAALGAITHQLRALTRTGAPRVVVNLSRLMLALYAVQMLVGALNVWWILPTSLRVVHLVLAGSVWTIAVAVLAAGSAIPRAGGRHDAARGRLARAPGGGNLSEPRALSLEASGDS